MIYINGRFLGKKDGIGRFSLEICRGLQALGLPFTLVVPEWLSYDNSDGFSIVRYGRLRSHFWEQVDLLRFLLREGRPLLVNFSGLGPVWYKNQVVTIHDLAVFVEPRWFSRSYRLFYRLATPLAARSARAILTVSNFSKGEILRFLDVPEGKITVIPNAVSRQVVAGEGTAGPIAGAYVLAVASLDPRKNHKGLINAFTDPALDDYTLVLVGKTASNFNLKLGLVSQRNIRFLGFVSDVELRLLYKGAAVFVCPSLYEGFGIPPLEAMANCCPVIVSDIPIFKEVCGDAVVYVDPLRVEAIRGAMLQVLSDASLQRELVKKGLRQSEKFSWNASAAKVKRVLEFLG
ncbi:glycosyltransferase family 4 protein [Dinghuibacter silviterrae]|uniref:Glycosyltransferase involved in cell wall biosynthesis n=1 Tax=Dinghuibacter silviterrae TaxID=1539049 RepID=A0A4R8DQ80_9BACT|nr:glycosyltransferase family 1 protein [Dinghuibacter silviterrae]TDX00069.1 glycosyltransferase involved in cell wall biosynthesis [Dinghuibacter silviterrae]